MISRTLIVALGLAAAVFAQDVRSVDRSQLDLSEIRRLPVLASGRFKPFDSYAREIVTAVTGAEKPKRVMDGGAEKRMDPVLVYLEWVFDAARARAIPQLAAPNAASRKLIAAARGEKDTNFSYDELMSNPAFVEAVNAALAKDSETWGEVEREIMALRHRSDEFADAAGLTSAWSSFPAELRGGPPMVPPKEARVPGIEYKWGWLPSLATFGYTDVQRSPVVDAWTRLRSAWTASDSNAFLEASKALRAAITALGAPEFPPQAKLDREVRFNLVNPFTVAAWLYFATFWLAVVWLVWSRKWFGFVAAVPALIGLGYHVWGSIERTALSEQALIGNLYESLLFVAGVAMLAGLAFEGIFRSRWCLLAGSLLAWVATLAALDNPLFMPPSIARLKPVLINNFWIHIHVPTIMASYATLGLAAVMSHVWLVLRLFRPETHPELRSISKFTYWITAPGVILLFAGMILGGIWADASWGRFWGWDPKETWAFITWLVFIVVIHGRWSGWLRDFGTAMGGVVGGLSLLFTYYGVNFFLSGLHSYAGAGSGGVTFPGWLIAWLTFEVLLVAASILKHSGSRTVATKVTDAETGPTAHGATSKPALRG